MARTIDSVAKLEFDRLLPGHGPLQADRRWMMGERNYLEELTERESGNWQESR